MKQIKGQVSLYDLFTQDVPLEACGAEHVGRIIGFRDLENYIGKRVVLSCPSREHVYYKVVIITSFTKDSDNIWKKKDSGELINDFLYELNRRPDCYTKDHVCDRIGYSDDNRRHKENSWVSEAYCSNGRWEPLIAFPECFFEYIRM